MKRLALIILSICGILFSQSAVAQSVVIDTIHLRIFSDSINLDEVVVKAKRTPAANSRFSDMKPVELVTVGGANGDLYKALQNLPGTQVQGESGRLLVRGGSSDETQTYIDGMHVLNPYTTTSTDTPARGRYSTFMFSGVNLASGGAPLEYGDALSAVLPLETKDRSSITKIGANLSSVGLGGGGTRVFDKSSLSVDLNYQDLGVYNKIYPGRIEFEKPYRLFSGATQFRYQPKDGILFKIYAGYDRTTFSNYAEDNHLFRLGENNVYLNTTFRYRTSSDWSWFAGVAYSYYDRKIGGAVAGGDDWSERQQEIHLKAKAFKRLSETFRLDVGAESFIRHYENHYRYQYTQEGGIDSRNQMNPTISAAYLTATYYPLERLKAELSFRTEYTSLNKQVNFSPRLAVNYHWGEVMLSATVGRYTQLPVNSYLVKENDLKSEVCMQYNLGAQYEHAGRFYKAEVYYKKYDCLALLEPDTKGNLSVLTSRGYGNSKGVDWFFSDATLWKNFEYQLAYGYNFSKRKYQEYTELTTPQYATRHNASMVVKYSIPAIHSIIGLTNRFSSGRPYHNPNLPGFMNDEVKPYNSLDLGLTFLASKKVIIHASATNILCRKNEFGRVNSKAIIASSDHFFYIGVYVTLGKKAAYDVSNF